MLKLIQSNILTYGLRIFYLILASLVFNKYFGHLLDKLQIEIKLF